jgi:DNA-binding NarL/FixJ family response regulator
MDAQREIIEVAVVEDSTTVRESLQTILNGTPGFRCSAACRDANEALQELRIRPPHVVLMDINLPRLSGIECVRQLRQALPKLLIIMLTIEENSRRVFESLEAGATGYLLKNVPPARILEAIVEVHRGGAPMSSEIARMLVQSFQRTTTVRAPTPRLTEREQEILQLVANGYRTKELAEALGISAQTVETHLRNIYDKLHVRSRAGAVARFLNGRDQAGQ